MRSKHTGWVWYVESALPLIKCLSALCSKTLEYGYETFSKLFAGREAEHLFAGSWWFSWGEEGTGYKLLNSKGAFASAVVQVKSLILCEGLKEPLSELFWGNVFGGWES